MSIEQFENVCKKFDFLWYWRDNAPARKYIAEQESLLKQARQLGSEFVVVYETLRLKAQNPYVRAG